MFCFYLGGELYYWRHKGTDKTVNTKVVCGAEAASDIFIDFHASPTGAHCGQTKTWDAISRRFYWPGMSVDINKWVSQYYIHAKDHHGQQQQQQQKSQELFFQVHEKYF